MSLENIVPLDSKIRYSTWRGTSMSRTYFKFLCASCGNEIWVPNSKRDLKKHSGQCRTCKGRSTIQNVLPGNRGLRKRPYEWLLNRLIHSSKKRGVVCNLTYDQFIEFTNQSECHYCGSPVTWEPHNLGWVNGNAKCNLDRKDNDQGYEKENLVVACTICNRMKNSYLSYEDMLELSPILRRIIPEKQWKDTRRKGRFHRDEVEF
jgi:hypothetical protein